MRLPYEGSGSVVWREGSAARVRGARQVGFASTAQTRRRGDPQRSGLVRLGNEEETVKYHGAYTAGLARKAGYKKELRRLEEARDAAIAHALGLEQEAIRPLDRVPSSMQRSEAEAMLAQLQRKLVEMEQVEASPDTALDPRSQVSFRDALTWLKAKVARLTLLLEDDDTAEEAC
jgi:hypothetical protein